MSTFVTFSHQYGLQNFNSLLHLSVLQDLSVVVHRCLSHRSLHIASKLNHGHNKQNCYGFVINKHSEVLHVRQQVSKITGAIEFSPMQNSY